VIRRDATDPTPPRRLRSLLLLLRDDLVWLVEAASSQRGLMPPTTTRTSGRPGAETLAVVIWFVLMTAIAVAVTTTGSCAQIDLA
jgi:hypothetical protein